MTHVSGSDDTDLPVSDPPIIAQFSPNLSELHIYIGNLKELQISSSALEYSLSIPLVTNYSQKQRIIALTENNRMQFNGDSLPTFPDITVIVKTFYYNIDERNLSTGNQIIETRLLIRAWETGNCKWNENQTDAVLDLNASPILATWIDSSGQINSVNCSIPSYAQ